MNSKPTALATGFVPPRGKDDCIAKNKIWQFHDGANRFGWPYSRKPSEQEDLGLLVATTRNQRVNRVAGLALNLRASSPL
jgi:hypothetical protein